MTLAEARGYAAGAWCAPENKGKVMDVELAEAFAKILVERLGEAIKADQKGFSDRYWEQPT